MSPGSKVKSEYMKRYKDPRWDMYGPCYRELLHYRLSRRLLEQAHNPWFWDDWGPANSSDDSSSSSGGGGSLCPAPQGVPVPPTSPPRPSAREDPDKPKRSAALELEASEDTDAGAASPSELPVREVEEQIRTKETDQPSSGAEPRQQPSALFARENKKTAQSPPRSSSKIRENKHPFALYGWGEKQTDTGSQKTHNVCASAAVHEIHESALRAKNRRQVEKRKLVAQRQRAHSVDVDKNRMLKPWSSDNPWMTEYMRCYSARA
ncbi:PREDICTED: centriole, cilia and spindle-associated protein [Chrysochloris asiatica]|uniref:Centriole, cilia and spindle-associated protein n=1 Tax=Chrysochloris asiatica TaxID=185453 RepID=A0A9B0TTX0_CHRAS|nr:PREDICTED: centriole, cilia and spindle-associated protein [Chrysochloris asiatica]